MVQEAKSELERFLKLHAQHNNAEKLFYHLEKAAGSEKVHQHNEELDSLFDLKHADSEKRGFLTAYWRLFTSGLIPLEELTNQLGFTRKADGQKIKALIRRAHFVRFPERHASELTEAQMLAQLGLSSTSAEQIVDASPEVDWSTEIVQQGFDAEYQGHDLIVIPTLETLHHYAGQWREDAYKAPYTSIISPTMSGKTRLLKELAKHVCVVYICLRKEGSTGQPPRSDLARHFIPEKGQLNMIQHYSHLLIAILKTVYDFFKRPDISTKSLEDQLSEWFDYSFQIKSTSKVEFNTKVENELNNLKMASSSESKLTYDDIQIGDLPTRQKLATAVSDVDEIMKSQGRGNLKVLLAIDEASNLIDHVNKQLNIPYFRVFRRALSTIPSLMGFFSVFTDTTSRVANFNPALDRDSSTRFHGRGVDLFAPIYKISTLDVFVPKDKPSSWNDLLSPERLFSYGCPFYGLYFKGANKKNPKGAVQTTAMIAQAKLLFKTQSASPGVLSSPQCFAILGSIIQTRVSLHAPINSELVASHAAHCMFIDSKREMIVSDYPPQFVYASAANRVLASDDKRWIECIDALASAVRKGLVALGDAGEMATRLILIRAMQKTEPIPHKNLDSIPNGYSVRLKDFLQTLSGKNPDIMNFDCSDEEYRNKLLDHGQVFFNHFTRISYTPSATDFLELLYRGVAVQCKDRQPGLDELFTIYLAPPSTSHSSKLDLSNITFCGIQTKNRTGSVRMDESHHWSKSFAKIEGINNPYLILLFSLKATSSQVTWKPPELKDDTQRVAYQFLGLGEIDCLTSEMRAGLERLITAIPDDLLNLHDNCNEKTKDWIKQLTPVFYPSAPEPVPSQKPSKPPAPEPPQKPAQLPAAKKQSNRTQQVIKQTCVPSPKPSKRPAPEPPQKPYNLRAPKGQSSRT
ncbi:hypothetical protein PGT21_032329 [Puccinia graminis f. sp. tritici]|uniref:Uncharacterized protein n=1 Tax=Puccinia graminis f. sp. tritici TaxID=56615 RepID=A0A5B0QK32_PUCGR|nr:hypothetical protein PGT21_032329 [Puccinia graminis f. sp. tritici]KAA1130791.1 hypothetical protein PGTUg99_019454 [Puccinia graminis f. sp. tritici]